MNISENSAELFKAISAAQGEFRTVEKNATNPHFKSKFAPLDSIIEMIRPIMPKHGLAALQFTDIQESGIVVETIITHESGQFISGKLFMPAVKQDPQGYGSALTYGRRSALGAALGIVSDEDVDGNGGGNGADDKKKQPVVPPQTPPQKQSTLDLIEKRIDSFATKTAQELTAWYLDDENLKLIEAKSSLSAEELSKANKYFAQMKDTLEKRKPTTAQRQGAPTAQAGDFF